MSPAPAVRLYNTLNRAPEALACVEPGTVRFYACGPTVYNRVHIGNLKTFVWVDFTRRVLEACGLRVRLVMNITDVDDRIIQGVMETGKDLAGYTTPHIASFHADLQSLACLPAERYPRATEFIAPMIAMVEQLITAGCAYAAEGSVYFRVAAFPAYGRLACLDEEGLQDGARVDSSERGKESPRDFALWKKAAPGEPAWDSPWGKGRPGWHLECSVMAQNLLGLEIDLHAGGVDLIFPHHTNEIAQSEGAHPGTRFARIWLHGEHLRVRSEKMSKSLGNFFTLPELTERAQDPVDPMDLRHLFLSTHYRKPLDYSDESLAAARTARLRLLAFKNRVQAAAAAPGAPDVPALRELPARFLETLADDLNVAEAFAAAFETLRLANAALDGPGLADADLAAARRVMALFDATFATLSESRDRDADRIEKLLEERRAARKAKDFARSDAIRDQLLAEGIEIMDSASGTTWRRR